MEKGFALVHTAVADSRLKIAVAGYIDIAVKAILIIVGILWEKV